MAVWTAILIGAVRFLTGPRLLAAGLLFPFTAMEVAGGNVSLLLAVAIVVGFRWPAAWALVLLTKITPGIGLLWFAVRRRVAPARDRPRRDGGDRRGVGVHAARAWRDWVDVVVAQRRQGRDVGVGAGPALDPPARSPSPSSSGAPGPTARWTVPVAAMLALPALWYGGISMLLAAIPLLPGAGPRQVAAGARRGLTRAGPRPTAADEEHRRPEHRTGRPARRSARRSRRRSAR